MRLAEFPSKGYALGAGFALTRRSMQTLVLCIVAVLSFLSSIGRCARRTLSGRIVGISDGDTLTILDSSNQQHRIRLSGIDAPEKKQPFGNRSKQTHCDF